MSFCLRECLHFQGEISLFISFPMRKMCRTNQQNSRLHGKSKQVYALSMRAESFRRTNTSQVTPPHYSLKNKNK